jgi:hypothetical protein
MFRQLSLATILAFWLTSQVVSAQQLSGDSTNVGPLPNPDAEGFIALLNDRHLAHWNGLPEYWSVTAGAISGHETEKTSKQTFLVFTGLEVKDFELRIKYRFSSSAGNSGIQFRSIVLDPTTFRVGGYQADFDAQLKFDGSIYDEAGVAGNRGTISNRGERTIWDSENNRHNEPLKESGASLRQAIVPGGWNDIVLIARGPHISYAINGHLMTDLVDYSPAALRQGILALQLHEGFTMDVRFKDVRLKILNN